MNIFSQFFMFEEESNRRMPHTRPRTQAQKLIFSFGGLRVNSSKFSQVSGSHSCEKVTESPGMGLETKSFDVEDKSPLNKAKPEAIPGFKPKICSASTTEYTCSMTRSVATKKDRPSPLAQVSGLSSESLLPNA